MTSTQNCSRISSIRIEMKICLPTVVSIEWTPNTTELSILTTMKIHLKSFWKTTILMKTMTTTTMVRHRQKFSTQTWTAFWSNLAASVLQTITKKVAIVNLKIFWVRTNCQCPSILDQLNLSAKPPSDLSRWPVWQLKKMELRESTFLTRKINELMISLETIQEDLHTMLIKTVEIRQILV